MEIIRKKEDAISGSYAAICRAEIKRSILLFVFIFSCLLIRPLASSAQNSTLPNPASPATENRRMEKPQRLTLEQCIDIAFKNSRLRIVSKASREMAEAQYKQALSAYWPQLSLTSTAIRTDEPFNFIFPGMSMSSSLGAASTSLAESIASTQLAKQGITPAIGLAAYNAALTAATTQAQQQLQSAKVPDQDVRLMDRDTLYTSLEMIFPLYTGGKRSAIKAQAKSGVEIAKIDSRRTDLQVVNNVKRFYYASILAKKLLQSGQETLERFQVTLELTENLYKNGAGKVKKTDYLRTQVVVASIRSFLENLKANEILSRSALSNAMGLDWQSNIEPAEDEIPFHTYNVDLDKFISDALKWNPQLMQVKLGIGAMEAKVKEARSGHLPVVVFFGNLNRIDNSYEAGLMTSDNTKNWSLGLRLELPLFRGFRTVNEEKEAAARVKKIEQESLLLQEGVALQVKDAFLQVSRTQAQVKAIKEALDAATENRDLNTRAYQEELVETKDVIEAQMIEFFINGQYLKAQYDNAVSQSDLEFIVGKNIEATAS